MSDKDDTCKPCPGGQVRRDGKCVMPEVTFEAFVMSLNTAALFHLGEIAEPGSGKRNLDLVLARHTIDTLAMLDQKTKGNLSGAEQEMLKDILYDLKLRYVKAKKEANGS